MGSLLRITYKKDKIKVKFEIIFTEIPRNYCEKIHLENRYFNTNIRKSQALILLF